MSLKSTRWSYGVTLEACQGQAYNEEQFRHLLDVEQRRAARSRLSFLLLLVNVRQHPGMRNRIPTAIATRIFAALNLSVREVDFMGWFREDRVAGAVLTQGGHPPASDAASRIGQRITETLRGHVPSDVAPRLHVRVLQLRPRQKG